MLLIYNLATWFYFILIKVASVFSPKAKKLFEGQKGALSQLRDYFSTGSIDRPIWIHVASLGEFEQGRPVIESIKSHYPKTTILLTFFSPSGYEVRKNYKQADIVTYLPFDTNENARAFIDITRPQLAIFVKYEFWYHYISAAHEAKVPLLSISTIFKPSQPFFKFYGGLHKSMLMKFDQFFVQNDQSLRLLQVIGVTSGIISGDTRYDRVIDISAKRPSLATIEHFIGNETVILVGSSWPSDLELIKSGLQKVKDSTKIIIAPHNVDEMAVSELLDMFPDSVRYSEGDSKDVAKSRTMIIDNMGMLSSLYGYADIAYVGGGARGALHNTLEPATWGIPVVFTKHKKNIKFQEAIDLVQNDAAFEISSSGEFEDLLKKLVNNEGKRKEAGRSARKQVEENAGATSIIMDYLTKEIDA